MDAAYVRMITEDGEYGLGEITHGQFCHEPIIGLVQHFDRLLKGRPVADINLLSDLMYQSSIFWNRQGVGIGVMGGIDIALYDVLGKLLDLPVYQLLGGRCRPRTRIYASNGLFDELESLVADAKRAQAFGFRRHCCRNRGEVLFLPVSEAHATFAEIGLARFIIRLRTLMPIATSTGCALS